MARKDKAPVSKDVGPALVAFGGPKIRVDVPEPAAPKKRPGPPSAPRMTHAVLFPGHSPRGGVII